MDTPAKACNVCGLLKPNTKDYYAHGINTHVDGTKVEYLTGTCKACRYERRKEIQRNHPTPEKYLAERWRTLCRTRPKKGIGIADDIKGKKGIPYLMEVWDKQSGLCAITGVPMTWGATEKKDVQSGKGLGRTVSVDRINNLQNYRKGNIQLVCAQVNFMRSSLSVEDFVAWCKIIVKNQSLD